MIRAYAAAVRSGELSNTLDVLAQASGGLRRESYETPRLSGARKRELLKALESDLVPALISKLGAVDDADHAFALGSTLYWALLVLGDRAEHFVEPLGVLLRPATAGGPHSRGHLEFVIRALGGLGAGAIKALDDVDACLDSSDGAIVEAAGLTLAAMGEQGGAALVRRLSSLRDEVRVVAAGALGRVRPFKTVWLFQLALAAETGAPEVCKAASGALLELSEVKELDLRVIVSHLRRLLRHRNARVRRNILRAVERMGPRGSGLVTEVSTALSDDDRSVRWAAAVSLGAIGAAAAPALAALDGVADSEKAHETFRRLARISAKQIRSAAGALSGGAER